MRGDVVLAAHLDVLTSGSMHMQSCKRGHQICMCSGQFVDRRLAATCAAAPAAPQCRRGEFDDLLSVLRSHSNTMHSDGADVLIQECPAPALAARLLWSQRYESTSFNADPMHGGHVWSTIICSHTCRDTYPHTCSVLAYRSPFWHGTLATQTSQAGVCSVKL